MSLLSWERGLKFICLTLSVGYSVAPLVGAWIEILQEFRSARRNTSLLSWERGLKLNFLSTSSKVLTVAPLVGAWIEISR